MCRRRDRAVLLLIAFGNGAERDVTDDLAGGIDRRYHVSMARRFDECDALGSHARWKRYQGESVGRGVNAGGRDRQSLPGSTEDCNGHVGRSRQAGGEVLEYR